jgi:hypothetical protein
MPAKKKTPAKNNTAKIPIPRTTLAPYEIALTAAMSNQHTRVTSTQMARLLLVIRRHVAEYGTVPDTHAYYFDTIAKIATTLQAKKITAATRRLETIDRDLERLHGNPPRSGAQDTACERWTPEVDAALTLGLGLGLALAMGGAR